MIAAKLSFSFLDLVQPVAEGADRGACSFVALTAGGYGFAGDDRGVPREPRSTRAATTPQKRPIDTANTVFPECILTARKMPLRGSS